MKVKIEPGVVVQLDGNPWGRTTSVLGGTYDISEVPEHQQKRILGIKGVSEFKAGKPEKEKS